jgi:DNA-binding CsgD family transcriptional regulator
MNPQNAFNFTKREWEVIELLLEGKNNKQIALALTISEGAVEFHLTRIYAKLGVGSRLEAIIVLGRLGKTPGGSGEPPVESDSGISLVENGGGGAHNVPQKQEPIPAVPNMKRANAPKWKWIFVPAATGVLLLSAAVLALYFRTPKTWTQYERECEYPDQATVGQAIARSNASGLAVHGQFGTISAEPWSASSGSVTYRNITTPDVAQLLLKVRYSKNSPSSAAVLVYLDEEEIPRASFIPKDQKDWNKFVWTESIFLGDIRAGVHSIRFATEGQKFGVADLDKFVLSAGPAT